MFYSKYVFSRRRRDEESIGEISKQLFHFIIFLLIIKFTMTMKGIMNTIYAVREITGFESWDILSLEALVAEAKLDDPPPHPCFWKIKKVRLRQMYWKTKYVHPFVIGHLESSGSLPARTLKIKYSLASFLRLKKILLPLKSPRHINFSSLYHGL